MLADLSHLSAQAGTLGPEVHLPATSLWAILDFVADQLPVWRDRSDRPQEQSETVLTSQLCDHLNSAARHSEGWDILQFRTEVHDEQRQGRKIDLVPKPCGANLCIDGRSYTDFDTLIPIECKRLPTPKDSDRDEREYVVHRSGSTGGIQRFKEGNHGATHCIGGMIGYVQADSFDDWQSRVRAWISDLAQNGESLWSDNDRLQSEHHDAANHTMTLRSSHRRKGDLDQIELGHIWISMY